MDTTITGVTILSITVAGTHPFTSILTLVTDGAIIIMDGMTIIIMDGTAITIIMATIMTDIPIIPIMIIMDGIIIPTGTLPLLTLTGGAREITPDLQTIAIIAETEGMMPTEAIMATEAIMQTGERSHPVILRQGIRSAVTVHPADIITV
jgi:hypothetical protein